MERHSLHLLGSGLNVVMGVKSLWCGVLSREVFVRLLI